MYPNMIYNHKKCYAYKLKLMYTNKYNTLYKNIIECYITKVVYNILNVLCKMLYAMLYSSWENQCNT